MVDVDDDAEDCMDCHDGSRRHAATSFDYESLVGKLMVSLGDFVVYKGIENGGQADLLHKNDLVSVVGVERTANNMHYYKLFLLKSQTGIVYHKTFFETDIGRCMHIVG